MLVTRHVFRVGTNCIAPSGLPLLLCLFPGLAPWAFLSRPGGASFAPETSLVLLGGRQVHKLVKFRPRGMVDKREMEQAQLFETADERGCTPMFGAAHRRASAVPYPRRYDVARYVHLVGTKFTNRSRFLSWPGRPCHEAIVARTIA